MKKKISSIFLLLLLFSCAEIVPPSGGIKDIIPPKVKKSAPENFKTNFKTQKIEIKFDEFIKLNTGGGSIIISPSLTKKPKFDLIGKKIVISFQEELLKETTYIINFGSSIKDNNEGNILQDYKFIFSTGEFIDSLKIEGRVIDAFTKELVEGVLVGLYPENEDSVLYKKPLYFTKTNKLGFYYLENLKTNNYQIAALEDKNLNYIFDQENERIAFTDSLIVLKENSLNNNLILFKNIKQTRVKEHLNKEANHVIFEFNKPFLDINYNITDYNEEELIYYSLDKKQLHYWYFNRDSAKTNFIINTNNEIEDSFSLTLKKNTSIKPFLFTLNNQKTEKNNKIVLYFPFPINSFDQKKLSIINKRKPIKYTTEWKNNNLKLEINTHILYDSLLINFSKNCFTSFHKLNSVEKRDTLSQFSKQLSNLILNINPKKNLLIELYTQDKKLIKKQAVSRETKIIFNNLEEGDYFIRIYKDVNSDNLWNSGLFHVKHQPEETLIYKSINLKENWDKEIDIKF